MHQYFEMVIHKDIEQLIMNLIFLFYFENISLQKKISKTFQFVTNTQLNIYTELYIIFWYMHGFAIKRFCIQEQSSPNF